MRLSRSELYMSWCLFSCIAPMTVSISQNKFLQSVEFRVDNPRVKNGHRIRRQASDNIREKYFLSVTHGPENYEARYREVQSPLKTFLRAGISDNDQSDVSAILKGYALFVKIKKPFEEFVDDGVSGPVDDEQVSTYDHKDDISPDDQYNVNVENFSDFKPYGWDNHHYLNDGDDYMHHGRGYIQENHQGNLENHDASKGESRESDYMFKTAFRKSFHGHCDDEHHSDYYGGHGDQDRGHHDAEFVFGDDDYVGNHARGRHFEEDQHHKEEVKADGFYDVFHKDQFKEVRDFYDKEDHGGRFYKNTKYRNRFDDSEGRIQKKGHKDSERDSDNFERSGISYGGDGS